MTSLVLTSPVAAPAPMEFEEFALYLGLAALASDGGVVANADPEVVVAAFEQGARYLAEGGADTLEQAGLVALRDDGVVVLDTLGVVAAMQAAARAARN